MSRLMPRSEAFGDKTGGRRLDFYSERVGDCILWRGATNKDGYGEATVANRRRKVHRLAYELARGPVPDGLEVDHLCMVRNCINPEHLEAVTHDENMRRRAGAKTHCKHGHEFTPENTRRQKSGRVCRTCEREANLRPELCPDCGRTYARSNLTKHMRTVHRKGATS